MENSDISTESKSLLFESGSLNNKSDTLSTLKPKISETVSCAVVNSNRRRTSHHSLIRKSTVMFRYLKKIFTILLFVVIIVLFLISFEDDGDLEDYFYEDVSGNDNVKNHHKNNKERTALLNQLQSSGKHTKKEKPNTQLVISEFFTSKNLKITDQGIFPLPELDPNLPVNRPANSVIPTRFYDKNFKREHSFNYILNEPHFCTGEDEIFLIVMIASASWEFKRREIIRSTWIKNSKFSSTNSELAEKYGIEKFSKITVKHLFFVATPSKKNSVNQILKQESEHYHDLIQEDFMETYKNLTLKTIGQLKWATYFCPNAKYVMHIDDDVYGAIPDIVNYALNVESGQNPSTKHLQANNQYEKMIYCSKVFMPVVRRDGKWEMSYEDYPDKQYPLGCVGWCFLLPYNVAKNLYFMSLQTPIIHLEDVTVTGILREKIGIEKVQKMAGNEQFCKHLGWPKDKPVEQKILEEYKSYHFSGSDE